MLSKIFRERKINIADLDKLDETTLIQIGYQCKIRTQGITKVSRPVFNYLFEVTIICTYMRRLRLVKMSKNEISSKLGF